MRTFAILCLCAAASLFATAYAQNNNPRAPGWEFGADLIYQDSTDLSFEGGSTLSLSTMTSVSR
jgi:hypothetical protein